MPPLPSVPNVIKVVVTNTGNDGRIAQNVTHYTYGGPPPGSGDLTSVCTDLWASWVLNITPLQPAQTSLTKIEAIDLSSAMGAGGEYDNGGVPVPGTSVHGMLPISTAFLVSKFVSRRYRGGHPRTYVPMGTTDDLNDDGDWKSGSVTAMLGAFRNYSLSVVGGAYGATTLGEECKVTYFSKNLNPVPPYEVIPPHVDDIPVDGYSAGKKLATQRRRVRRAGHG